MTSQSVASARRTQSPGQFIGFTAAAAVTAATAAFISVIFALPVWAMFIGWVAYYTRGHSARDGLANFICLMLGVAFGMVAASAIAALAPALGVATIGVVVFVVAAIVVSLRVVPVANNILSYFLGLISFFAAHLEPALSALVELGSASAIGCFAGWIANSLQSRLARAA